MLKTKTKHIDLTNQLTHKQLLNFYQHKNKL